MATILGWFFIIMGVVFILKPQVLRDRLRKKSYKTLRKYLLLLSILVGILLITTALKHEGLMPKVIMVLGVIAILKGFFLLKARAAEGIAEWFSKKPLIIFRIGAIIHIGIGIMLLNLH